MPEHYFQRHHTAPTLTEALPVLYAKAEEYYGDDVDFRLVHTKATPARNPSNGEYMAGHTVVARFRAVIPDPDNTTRLPRPADPAPPDADDPPGDQP